MLVNILNDVNSDYSNSLQDAIERLPGVDTLRFKPEVQNEEVGTEIIREFEDVTLVPTLLFIDPWGYKGLSLRLINSVLKDWACECIFFFNYNRINMGLPNELVEEHMNALFGEERADALRDRLNRMPPTERELEIVEQLSQALKEMGGEFVLPFRFRNESGTRTSHHLIFVSKNVLGYTIMKEIMAKESSSAEQEVPSFEYSPATLNQPLLFELARPLDDLAELLLRDFAGRKLKMVEVFEEHHIGHRYIKANYKQVLATLESSRKITADPPAVAYAGKKARRAGTFADSVLVSFPPDRRG
jgi:three-Cys-motif partner protein